MNDKKILVLGVGNVLLHDEGIGVHLVKDLEASFTFSDNVTLLDGGTLGLKLLNAIEEADYMIVADCGCDGKKPGTITRLTSKDLKDRVAAKNSMHQVSFLETLSYAAMLGILPETVLICCEPENLNPWGMSLSPCVEAARPQMLRALLHEIELAGGKFAKRIHPYCATQTLP